MMANPAIVRSTAISCRHFLSCLRHKGQGKLTLKSGQWSCLTAAMMSSDVTYSSGSDEFIRKFFPVNQQTVILPGPERIRSSRANPNIYKPDQYYSDVSTLCEAFKRGKLLSNDGPFLGKRRIGHVGSQGYEWSTFSQVEERAILFASGLIALGNQPGQETFIGIFSQNRPEWVITDIACMHYSMISVPFYNTVDIRACDRIISQTNMNTIVCDTLEKAERLRVEHSALRSLKNVIVMDLPTEALGEQKAMFEAEGLNLMSFDDVISCGTKNIVDRVLPKPETICTLVYTSGTTGLPKGVPHTHKGLIATHAYSWQILSMDVIPDHRDAVLSYLPLPHVYERSSMHTCMMAGTRMGFFQGDPLKLLEDIQALRPTAFAAVPRVLNRLYDRVMSNVNASSLPKRTLFHHALKQKLKIIDSGDNRTNTIWDKLVFNKIRSLLGGRIKFACSAAAPLSPDTAQFIRAAMSPNFIEAYGQTEAPLICHGLAHDHTSGHVGIPAGDVQIKLVDVPELDYYSKDDQGEVCVKGNHVFSGYFKDPELTSQVLQDGWIRTGDIGRWNKRGNLSIIDRKKDIFKLSQGVYIAPEKIENVYLREPLVAQAFVTGDATKNSLVGIMVPDQEELEKFAKKHKIPGCFEELCQNEKVKAAIFSRAMKHGKAEGLAGFEQVKGIHIHSEPFTEDAGLLTPTLKSKRNVMHQIFAEEINEMYSEIDQGDKRLN